MKRLRVFYWYLALYFHLSKFLATKRMCRCWIFRQIIEVSANSKWISRNDAKFFSSNENKTKKEPTSHTYRRIWKWTCQQNFNRSNCQNGQVLLKVYKLFSGTDYSIKSLPLTVVQKFLTAISHRGLRNWLLFFS